MKKFFKYLAFALIALIFIGTFVYIFAKSRTKEIIYKEIPVEIKDIRKTSVVTGRIEPRNEVNIKPQINGIISELYKEAGQMVREGVCLKICSTAGRLLKLKTSKPDCSA